MSSISLERCEINEDGEELPSPSRARKNLLRCGINEDGEEQIQIVNEMKDFVLDIASEGRISLEEAEELVTEACDSWKRKLLEICISKKASEEESEPIQCPKCK